jgi:hypothetical protein
MSTSPPATHFSAARLITLATSILERNMERQIILFSRDQSDKIVRIELLTPHTDKEAL